jgi:hypothetical protein
MPDGNSAVVVRGKTNRGFTPPADAKDELVTHDSGSNSATANKTSVKRRTGWRALKPFEEERVRYIDCSGTVNPPGMV